MTLGRVVHLVSQLRPGGQGHSLWPTLLALSDSGVQQCVVLMDGRDVAQVKLMLPPLAYLGEPGAAEHEAQQSGWWRRWASVGRIGRRFHQEVVDFPMLAVHLHGVPACLLGRHELKRTAVEAPLFLHVDSDTAVRSLARKVGWRSVFQVRPDRVEPLDSVDAATLGALAQPVDEVYFQAARQEAPAPLLVTTGHPDDFTCVQAFVQLAVMLSGMKPALSFAWLGEVTPAVQQILQAAGIRVVPARTPAQRAEVLQTAWVYVAPDPHGTDVRGLVEAMAAGVPCVAAQVPHAYAPLIIHSLSGFLAHGHDDMLACIARLVESGELRMEMGLAARTRARHRHGRHRFRASMLLAHGLPPAPAPASVSATSRSPDGAADLGVLAPPAPDHWMGTPG